jgi:hypothetical protein
MRTVAHSKACWFRSSRLWKKVRLHRPKAAFLARFAVGVILLMTEEAESILLGEGFHLRRHHRVPARSAQPCQIGVVDNADRRRMLPEHQSLMQEALHPKAIEHPIEAQVPSFGVTQV